MDSPTELKSGNSKKFPKNPIFPKIYFWTQKSLRKRRYEDIIVESKIIRGKRLICTKITKSGIWKSVLFGKPISQQEVQGSFPTPDDDGEFNLMSRIVWSSSHHTISLPRGKASHRNQFSTDIFSNSNFAMKDVNNCLVIKTPG